MLGDRNAADAIPWVLIEARPEHENQTLVEGMESLPRALAARFVEAGGELLLDCTVSGVDVEGADDAILVVASANDRTWRTRRLVLALPPHAFSELAGASSLLDRGTWAQLMESVDASAAAKLFLAFERAWWRDAGFRGVRLVSDGPLSKTYAFDFGVPPDGPATSPALLLASYSDGPVRDEWVALRDAPEGIDTGDHAAARRWDAYPASEAQIVRAREALGDLFPGHAVPAPIGAALQGLAGQRSGTPGAPALAPALWQTSPLAPSTGSHCTSRMRPGRSPRDGSRAPSRLPTPPWIGWPDQGRPRMLRDTEGRVERAVHADSSSSVM